MKFDMKRPCGNCPFRKVGGIRLHPERAREIAQSQIDQQGLIFPCHKTVDYDQEQDEDGNDTDYLPRVNDQYCAGALNFTQNVGTSNQMIRIAARTGWDWQAMEERDACFSSVRAMVAAQKDNDPKVVHRLPHRYRGLFREVRTNTADGLQWYYLWECRRCGQQLKPNTAGAQSHTAKHLRQIEDQKA